MLRLRQEKSRQLCIIDQLLPAHLTELPEELQKLDAWLNDERFFIPFKNKYHQRLGRPSVPVETYLRITVLKHQHNLSDRLVCELVDDRLSWRRFCHIPWEEPVPHPSALSKIRKRLDAGGDDHMALLNDHLVRKAKEEKLLKGRKVRVDTTVVESNIHYPTDSSLIFDAVKVVTRLAQKVSAGNKSFRDRTRSIKKRVLKITKVLKRRSNEKVQEVRQITQEMADIAVKTFQSAHKLLEDSIGKQPKHLVNQLEVYLALGEQVVQQANLVNNGQKKLPERVVSLFDPDARPIRRGKLNRPNEFGCKVRLTESKERIITEYEVFTGNPSDKDLLQSGIKNHVNHTGKVPDSVVTDRGFWDPANEKAVKEMGVKKVSLPFKGKRSRLRTEHERMPWFRRLQRWRAGQEGTISVLKRRYGMARSLYRKIDGNKRWVGGSIFGYNLNRIVQLI